MRIAIPDMIGLVYSELKKSGIIEEFRRSADKRDNRAIKIRINEVLFITVYCLGV
jgi:hypothetical protein